MSTSLTAVQRFVFPRGDTWPMLVDYLDPATGLPIDTAGSVVIGQLDLARNVRPIPLTVANGGLTIDPVTKRMRFVATPTVTSSVVPDNVALDAVPATYTYPNRLIVIVQDSAGEIITRGIFPMLAFDARNVPIGSIPQDQAVTMTASGPAGPSGPAVSVNGHAGPIQTVTADDVGAYTTGETDTAITTALAGYFTKDQVVALIAEALANATPRTSDTLQAGPAALALSATGAILAAVVRSHVMLGTQSGAVALMPGLAALSQSAVPVSAPGGGPANTADHSDPNNAYLAAMAA